MSENELEFYLRKGRAERSKAVYGGFRALKRALVRGLTRLNGGFAHLHQPKAFQ